MIGGLKDFQSRTNNLCGSRKFKPFQRYWITLHMMRVVKPSAVEYLALCQRTMLAAGVLSRMQRRTRIVGYRAVCCREHCAFGRLVFALKVITDVLHFHPFDSWLGADILDQSEKTSLENVSR